MSDDADPLVAFLRARLDEDERRAQDAIAVRYRGYFDGPRALREVAAKREILIAYIKAEAGGYRGEGWITFRFAVETLAAIWSDHPDYRPVWEL